MAHPRLKEDIERYILGHAGKGAHCGYGKRWETVTAAVEVTLRGGMRRKPMSGPNGSSAEPPAGKPWIGAWDAQVP
jgi:hypothetical protein